MSENLEHSFVALKENQNIIHKICRLYTNCEDSHKDLFQEVTIQLWKAFPKFRGDSKFSIWAYRVAIPQSLYIEKQTLNSYC
jgi:RNA polymerase sigma-70 factor (ECF subfamily)